MLTPDGSAPRISASEEACACFNASTLPALVATADRKGLSSMDIVAVLTKVVQEQQRTIDDLQTRLQQLETKK